ncbi:MAG: PHP domain-containing protein [Clostridia bacterium]|nr:PHP domain-containing protein [Clostridia bacterium]
MNKYYYDLHIHSCLSPCGDDDNTPNNIAGMASLCGLNIVALTDHNTSKNCPAFFTACKKYGIIAVAGMELTTAEDIHVICLFPTLQSAMDFDTYIYKRRILIKNREDIFGKQQILDGEDNIIGTEENLLINATSVSLEEAPKIVNEYGGVCYPAHIDKSANGIISILGTYPDSPKFNFAELHDKANQDEYGKKYGINNFLFSSDAHYLTAIKDKENSFLLCDEPYSSDNVRKNLIDFLKGDTV